MSALNSALAAGESAANYFGNGYHCAEAVVAAVLEEMGHDPKKATAHATAFGGGFGRTFTEACGALCGALIVIGHFHGREVGGDDWDLPAALGEEMRLHFIREFATTHCATLRQRFGDEDQMSECRNIVTKVAAYLVKQLEDQNRDPECSAEVQGDDLLSGDTYS